VFSSKDEDHLLKGVCHPEPSSFANSPFEPVIKAQVLINQETPHLHLHWLIYFITILIMPHCGISCQEALVFKNTLGDPCIFS